MINYEREDSFFEHYKNFMEGERNLSEEEFFNQIKKPEFSQALCYFVVNIIESDLYKELFGEAKQAKLIKDDKYGYCELSCIIENTVADEHHSFNVNMEHLYTFSEYLEEEPLIKDIGEFREIDIAESSQTNEEVLSIYQDLIEANKDNPYVKTFQEIKNAEELLKVSEFKAYSQKENPFDHLNMYSGCIGLNYMDTSRPFLSGGNEEHRAIVLESPIGPLAYLHFKSSLRDEDPDNTFYLSSIGVIPPLREKGVSKQMYQLADKNLGFNEDTLVYRTRPGCLAPKEFTNSIPNIVKGHKALYLHHELSEMNYFSIDGFSSLSKKEQVSELRDLNNKFIEETQNSPDKENSLFSNRDLRYKLFVEFKEKIEGQEKNKKQKKPSLNSLSP